MLISNKLLSHLATFSKHDLNSFKKFINSPFHNEQTELILLFDIVDGYFRASDKEKKANPLEKKRVWKAIFNKKPYQDVRLRRLSSDLIKLIYSFLAYTNFQKQDFEQQLNLLNALNKPPLKKYFDSTLAQIQQAVEKKQLRNANYHLYSYSTNYKLFNSTKDFREKIALFNSLEKADYHLEAYYITKKLENYCDYLSFKSIISIDAEVVLPPDFLDYVAHSAFINEPAIKAYYLVAKMLLSPEEETFFFNLKEHLEQNTSRFTLQELDIFYINLKNYCIAKSNKGETAYFIRLFEIFQTLLQEKIIFKDGTISPQSYKNIVTVGLLVKEYDWVESFIQKYTNLLPKEHRENALAYNLSKVYFHEKKYDKVIEQLREVEYKNHTYSLGGKLTLLKTYYELKEYQALNSLIDSFRIYIRRNKIISRQIKQQYLNVLRFVKKLSTTLRKDKKSIEKIKSQIDKCKALADKKWILEKVEELAK